MTNNRRIGLVVEHYQTRKTAKSMFFNYYRARRRRNPKLRFGPQRPVEALATVVCTRMHPLVREKKWETLCARFWNPLMEGSWSRPRMRALLNSCKSWNSRFGSDLLPNQFFCCLFNWFGTCSVFGSVSLLLPYSVVILWQFMVFPVKQVLSWVSVTYGKCSHCLIIGTVQRA